MHSGSQARADAQITAFEDTLAAAGYVDGKNNFQIIDRLYANDDPTKLGDHANTFIQKHKVNLLVAAGGTASANAAQQATSTIPIVFTSVAYHTSPAKNMTGVCARTTELDPDRLSLLHELLPDRTTIGVLTNSSRPGFSDQWKAIQDRAGKLPVTLSQQDVPAHANPGTGEIRNQIDQAFQNFQDANIKLVLVTADPMFNNHRTDVAPFAKNRDIAVICQWRQMAVDGALMTYGTKLSQAYRMAAAYVASILKGAKPENLNVQVAPSTELILNRATANTINVAIPATLLARADEIIN